MHAAFVAQKPQSHITVMTDGQLDTYHVCLCPMGIWQEHNQH